MVILLTLLLAVLLCLVVGLPTRLLANLWAVCPGHPQPDDWITALILVAISELGIAGILYVCYQLAGWILTLIA
ncbi:hypothetical protein [Bifidobacterium vansinderenii]|uniref:Uncharacterized protein n=1 Tax=Bifidobacterium vansinderenii TaxID=1984871 RepID=A0A229W0R2_9BIFI|nr:hypothetical protein [Bifidobacterium vansinderenii]OXN01464.1 hypothetical protein Tam10B_0467 [Bifidobacterium vansinderenii]